LPCSCYSTISSRSCWSLKPPLLFCVGESAAPARVHSVFQRPIRTTLPSSQSSCASLRAPAPGVSSAPSILGMFAT
jgi:hypothetical protein